MWEVFNCLEKVFNCLEKVFNCLEKVFNRLEKVFNRLEKVFNHLKKVFNRLEKAFNSLELRILNFLKLKTLPATPRHMSQSLQLLPSGSGWVNDLSLRRDRQRAGIIP